MQRVHVMTAFLLLGCFSQAALANVIGTQHQNFNPSLSVQDMATVHAARTIGRGRLGLGLFVNTAVNTLPYFNQENVENRDREKNLNDTITSLDLTVTYGLLERWDISLTAPYVIQQSLVEDEQSFGYFSRLGNTELRVSTKVRVLSLLNADVAVLAHANYNRVDDNPYTGRVDWPTFSLELATTFDLGLLDLSINLGHRWERGEQDPELQERVPVKPLSDQWLASTGVTVDLPATDLDVVGEIYGTYVREDFSAFSPRNASVLEALAGVRYPLTESWQLHAGGGAEMRHAVSSADFRAYIGIRWVSEARQEEVAPASPVVAPAQAPQAVFRSISELPPDAVFEVDDVYFHFDSTALRDTRGYQVMEQLSLALREKPIERVVIEGHACALGTDDYNLALSDRRAESIERWLIQNQGVPPERLVTVGWGERQPKENNVTEASRMLNRRVTFKIYYQALVGDPAPQATAQDIAATPAEP